MKHISIPLFLLGLALSALPASAGAPGAAADSLRAERSRLCTQHGGTRFRCTASCPRGDISVALDQFYEEPFTLPPEPYLGPPCSYEGLFLLTGSTALANALVVAGGAHADALAAAGLTLGVLSLVASLSERTQARPAHFILGVTTIALSLMNISNPPDTRGPADVQSGTSYKGPPLGLSLSF